MSITRKTSKMPTSTTNKPYSAVDVLKYWPITVFCITSLVSLGILYQKIDYVVRAVDKYENQFSVINDRQTLFSQGLLEIRGKSDLQNQQLMQLSKENAAMNERLVSLERNSRYTPR